MEKDQVRVNNYVQIRKIRFLSITVENNFI